MENNADLLMIEKRTLYEHIGAVAAEQLKFQASVMNLIAAASLTFPQEPRQSPERCHGLNPLIYIDFNPASLTNHDKS